MKKKEKYFEAIGRRKSATSRVRLYEKKENKIIVNGKDFEEYFPYPGWQELVLSPLKETKTSNKFFISIIVKGGGKRGQAEAIRLAIARALVKWNPELKKILKELHFLTRDARVKERKKPGLKRARRAPQWQKR